MTDWVAWHERYDNAESDQAQRLVVVQQRISEALSGFPPGPIRLISMCAGEGRDILGVLERHERAPDVNGRLVELDPVLAERARSKAPSGIEVVQSDASLSDVYEGAAPADLLLSCGIFGNISDEDIRRTIEAWPMLCVEGAIVLWTRGGRRSETDLRPVVRSWVTSAGFEEIAFDSSPTGYGVGVARMVRPPSPLVPGQRFFTFTH